MNLLLGIIAILLPFQETTGRTAIPASRQADHVAIIEVHTPIDTISAQSIKRRMQEAEAEGADAVVLELNTPGGDLESMLEICRLLKEGTPMRTTAWINHSAYSAGAIIALATEEIVMARGARMGDAAPIAGIPGAGMIQLPAAERAKIESPLLAEVVDSARRNGYDEKLVQSFVGVRFALWEIEERDGNGRAFVDANEYIAIFGEAPPLQRVRGGSPQQASTKDAVDKETSELVDVLQEVVSSRRLPGPEEAGNWKLRGQIVGDEELLIVDDASAMRAGLAKAVIVDDTGIKEHFGAAVTTRHGEQWSELLVRFLTSWPVRIILIAIIVIGFFLEIAAPGTSVFGGAALVALMIMLGAPLLVGMASWWEVLLVILGLLLIGIEILVIPGMGVAGILGAVCLLVGLVGVFVTADYGTVEANNQIFTAVIAIFGAMLFGGVAAWWVARQSGGFWLFRRMVLDAQSATPMIRGLPGSVGEAHDVTGRTGVAETDLRPSGRIRIDKDLYSARSTTGWIGSGDPVRVLGKFGGEWEVEPLHANKDDEAVEPDQDQTEDSEQ